MNTSKRTKRRAPIFFLLLCLGIPGSAQAQGIVHGSTVPAGEIVNQDLALVGQDVSIDGTINGNVFILGNQVEVNGTVDGSLILIGQNAALSGRVSGTIYALALTLELTPQASLGRDLYIACVSLVSGQDSRIGRDLLAVGLDAGLNGQVGRSLHTAIGPIQLYNGLMHLLGFDELALRLHFDLPQAPPAPSPSSGSPHLASLYLPRSRLRPPDQAQAFDWGQWAIDRARDWLVLSLLSLMAFWLLRSRLKESGQPLRAHPLKTTALGLLVLVIAINLFGVALLLAVAVFALGLALNFLGVWQLSMALWVAAYATLALAVTALWFFIVYGTKIIVVYLVSDWVTGRFKSAPAWWLIPALLGWTLTYVLLRAVPLAGWVLDLLVSAAGIGSAWLAYRAARRLPSSAAPKTRGRRSQSRSASS